MTPTQPARSGGSWVAEVPLTARDVRVSSAVAEVSETRVESLVDDESLHETCLTPLEARSASGSLTARGVQLSVGEAHAEATSETPVESLTPPLAPWRRASSPVPQPSASALDSDHGGDGTSAYLPDLPDSEAHVPASHLTVMEALLDIAAAVETEASAPAPAAAAWGAPGLLNADSSLDQAPTPGQGAAPVLAFAQHADEPHEPPQHEDTDNLEDPPQHKDSEQRPDALGSSDASHDSSDSETNSPRRQDTGGTKGRVEGSGVSGVSMLGHRLRRASDTMKAILVGDDHAVRDKWDSYDDDAEEEIEAAKRAVSTRCKHGGQDSKVHPAAASAASSRMLMSMDGTSATNAIELLGEKRSGRTLIWHYFQTFMFSMLLTAVCLPLISLVSLVKWHEEVDGPPDTNNGTAVDGAGPTPSFYSVRPNHKALQLMLLFQIIFPLCIYAVLLYACIRRTFRLPWPMIALLIFTISWATLVCGLFYKFDVAFWFYYIDLFIIVAAYVPCMCMVGWYVEVDENATVKQRLTDVFFTALLETVVAAATLVYCFFIMPLFFTLTNAWLQMLWLCVLHPLYFETTTGFIVRKTLHRNRQLGRNHILYLLTIVHSMVHLVVLATSLQASIEPIRILALTILLYNLSKMIWRSTVLQRDLFIERLIHGWSFNYSIDELAELSRMVSVGIITEIILENASIFIAPFMMFRMYKEPIFMAVVPNTFFNNGGTYPVQTLLILIAMLLSFTMIFDLSFYFLNYHMVQHLPLINTWRRIKRSQGWYLAFLVYAFASMGVLFLFLTMMILPRAAYCKTDNYCDCATLTYKTICEGQYISTLVDYLV